MCFFVTQCIRKKIYFVNCLIVEYKYQISEQSNIFNLSGFTTSHGNSKKCQIAPATADKLVNSILLYHKKIQSKGDKNGVECLGNTFESVAGITS